MMSDFGIWTAHGMDTIRAWPAASSAGESSEADSSAAASATRAGERPPAASARTIRATSITCHLVDQSCRVWIWLSSVTSSTSTLPLLRMRIF